MSAEEWLAKKAKQLARQQALNVADKLTDNAPAAGPGKRRSAEEWLVAKTKEVAKRQALNIADKLGDKEAEAAPGPNTGRMGSIDGKPVPELLAAAAPDVPRRSPGPESILRGLPAFGKDLLALHGPDYEFREEVPEPVPESVAPPAPLPVVQPPKKISENVLAGILIACGVVGYLAYKHYDSTTSTRTRSSLAEASPANRSSPFDTSPAPPPIQPSPQSSSRPDSDLAALERHADEGDAHAQYLVGKLAKNAAISPTFREVFGEAERAAQLAKAKDYFTRAAQQGHKEAQGELASMQLPEARSETPAAQSQSSQIDSNSVSIGLDRAIRGQLQADIESRLKDAAAGKDVAYNRRAAKIEQELIKRNHLSVDDVRDAMRSAAKP